MSDPDGLAVEADANCHAASRNAIATDQRLGEIGAVTREPAGQRNAGADGGNHSVDELAAVDIQPIGQKKHTGQMSSRKAFPIVSPQFHDCDASITSW